jgi:PAS domain-containing protein
MNVPRFQYDLFRVLAPVLIGVLSLLLVGSCTPERRRRPETRVYILFLIATIGFLAMNFMEMISRSEAETLLWSKFIYLFIGFIPLIWIDFCVRFTHEGRGLDPKIIAAITAIPLATFVVIFVPDLQVFMWNRIEYFTQGDFTISRRDHGPWFTVYAVYTYASIATGAAIVIRHFPRQRSFYRRQSFVILAGLIVPLAASLVYILKLVPGLIKDYTPFGYAVSACIFYVALFRMDVFSLVPVGRAVVMERLGVGILVLDREWRLADANPAAMRILGIQEHHIGRRVAGLAGEKNILPRPIVDAVLSRSSTELKMESADGSLFYRIDASPIEGAGALAVISEITELRRLLTKVEELARTDELTGLPNRRAFMEEARREIARALRRGI